MNRKDTKDAKKTKAKVKQDINSQKPVFLTFFQASRF